MAVLRAVAAFFLINASGAAALKRQNQTEAPTGIAHRLLSSNALAKARATEEKFVAMVGSAEETVSSTWSTLLAKDSGETMAQRMRAAEKMSEAKRQRTSYKVSLPQLKKDSPTVKPIGEGAYQSAEAVKQRTTDARQACEEGKNEDCYKVGGDYTDGRTVTHSGAMGVSVSLALVASAAVAVA